MSACGTKRTSSIDGVMSANDPKRTSNATANNQMRRCRREQSLHEGIGLRCLRCLGWGPTSAKIDRDYITAFGSRRRGERRGSAYDRKGRVVERRLSARASDKCIAKRAAGTDGKRDRDVTAHSDRSGFVAGEGSIHVGRIGRI